MEMNQPQKTFESFEAAALYCPQCRSAMPVRKKLLLLLPNGELYDLLCSRCFSSIGIKKEEKPPPHIIPPGQQ
ncbi:MAG: cytoplasmic protein [Deltaproteobacteria bacterium]|nr:cytoplasmic protein [Deltaproteobacteria bacterium]